MHKYKPLKACGTTVALAVLATAPALMGAVGDAGAVGKQIYFGVDASNPVLEISIDSSTVMQLTPTSNGSFGMQDIPVTVGTNSATGYTLNMYAEEPALSCHSNTNCTSSTIGVLASNNVSADTFSATGVAGDATMNKWGYSINSGYTLYNPMPDSDAAVTVGSKDTNVANDTTNVRFGVKMNSDIPAGTYGTTITFVALTNRVETCAANSICYVGNGGSGGMDVQTASSGTTQLWASNYRRDGYGFAGWNTKADGTGTNYGPNEDIASSLAAGGLYLYANWIASAGNLQSWSGCGGLATGGVTALTDTRDGNVYAVARLADGKCWMIENLRLNDLPTLTNGNTKVASGWTMTTDYATGTKSNHLATPSVDASYWCTTANSAACYDQSRLATQNTADSIGFMSADEPTNGAVNGGTKTGAPDNNIYSYGNYYNWYSATAGSGTQSVGTKNSDVANSICPSGNWRLPTGGGSDRTDVATTSDFWKLGLSIMGIGPNVANNTSSYYDSTTAAQSTVDSFAGKTTKGLTATKAFRTYPNNFLFSGHQNGAATNRRGANGLYWASTARSTQHAYDLDLNTSAVYPGAGNGTKYYGFSVRCVIGS